MDFSVSDKMQTIIGMMDEFVDKKLMPLEPGFLARPLSELWPVLEEKRSLVRQMELWAPNHPREYGGMGLDLTEHALVSESLVASTRSHSAVRSRAFSRASKTSARGHAASVHATVRFSTMPTGK